MCFGSVLHSTSYSMQEYTDMLWGCPGYDQKTGLVHLKGCYWLSVQLCPLTGETTVGRGAECEVCIPAKSLSRAHAVLMVDGGTHFIQDLGSRNKTYRGNVSSCRPQGVSQWDGTLWGSIPVTDTIVTTAQAFQPRFCLTTPCMVLSGVATWTRAIVPTCWVEMWFICLHSSVL